MHMKSKEVVISAMCYGMLIFARCVSVIRIFLYKATPLFHSVPARVVRHFMVFYVCPFIIVQQLTTVQYALASDSAAFLSDVIKQIEANYVKKVDDNVLIEGALEGMLPALDPHSMYLNPKSLREISNAASGEFCGIGVELIADHGALRVISPYENSPAFDVGIRANDIIVGIDGKSVVDIEGGPYGAIEKLRGENGTVVTLTVLKESGQIVEYKVIRTTIKIQSVNVKLLANKTIAYIKIKYFNEQTARSIQRELENLKKIPNIHLDGLIIDLRWNPGGPLDQAIGVADLFLDDVDIVSVRGREEDSQITYHSNEGDISENLPIVVITNSGTASASEIVASAMQDNRRALILGTRTFGKGSVQNIIPLSNGGAMKLTTDLYYTPSGKAIQAIGITPDIVVEEAVVNRVHREIDAISESSLKHHIAASKNYRSDEANANHVSSSGSNNKDLERGMNAKSRESTALVEKAIGDESQDFQLMRAIDTIKGMSLLIKDDNQSALDEDSINHARGDEEHNNTRRS